MTRDTLVIFSSDNGPVYDDGYDDGTVVKTSREEVDQGHDASGPYRGGKYQIYEGGTRVPFIVSWPGTIRPGTSQALVSHTDFIRSFASLLDRELPPGAAPDGRESMKALLGRAKGNRYLIEESGKALALRDGDWKLIRFGHWDRTKIRYELYNLANDVAEQNNVFQKYPERVKGMRVILDAIASGKSVRAALGEI